MATRQRRKADIQIEVYDPKALAWRSALSDGPRCESTDEAAKAIRDCGDLGVRYRIIDVKRDDVVVSVRQQRTLVARKEQQDAGTNPQSA